MFCLVFLLWINEQNTFRHRSVENPKGYIIPWIVSMHARDNCLQTPWRVRSQYALFIELDSFSPWEKNFFKVFFAWGANLVEPL